MPKGSRPKPCGFCGGPRPAGLQVRSRGRDISTCAACKTTHGVPGYLAPGGIPRYLNRAFREANPRGVTR